ncbi:MAG: phosphoribosylformylglycinamidine synthase, partial [Euryarchaeota archaeon]|nr:phosphoribosylformylglycinamidine synthase [Euryarchaeota archaeon]
MLESDYGVQVNNVRVILGYQVKSDMSLEQATRSIYDLFADPIIEVGNLENSLLDNKNLFSEAPQIAIKVGFKPGVTDNAGQAGLDGLRTIFPEISSASQVATAMTYLFWGVPGDISPNWLSSKLHNQMIERSSISDSKDCQKSVWPSLDFPERPKLTQKPSATVNLEVSDEELIQISEKGLLALNLEEMKAIQKNYRDPKVRAARVELGLPEKAPTDAELECLAQTWSEHCCHKIFASKIHHVDFETGEDTYIDSLFKTHIMKPTLDIQSEVNWLLSIFHDNSGVIAWNDDWSLCIKAETHNSPSALDPFGGAMTGIVGVNRDILGTGLGARPIANTDVFCFGPPDYSGHIPEGLFHPSRVFRGVHAGVRAGGNESGIPTVNGSIVFDERYLGKPLVYCGTVGIMPRLLPDGRESHEKTPQPGNIIYMVGGRVGSDGIHGATFSSLELTEDSP